MHIIEADDQGVDCGEQLGAFATDATSELDILRHDSDPLGMDGAQIGILEQADHVGLGSFLQSHDGGALKSKIRLEILCDLTDQALERQLSDEQFGRLLETTDLTKGDGTRPEAVRLLHPAGCGC